MSAAFSTSTEVGMLDARTSLGSVTLPLTTDIPSRMITLKDVFGTAANSTITIKTQGSDLFEDGTTSKTMAANYDFMTLHAGSTNRWYIHATSLPPTMTMGSTITRFLSASNATISSINGAVPLLPANIASTVQGLVTVGYISTTSLTSSLQGLGIAGYISTLSLTSTVVGLTTQTSNIAAAAFTGSTTSLSAATIFVSSISASNLTVPFSTLSASAFFSEKALSSGTQLAHGTGGAYGQFGKYSQFYINDLKNQIGQINDTSPTVLIEQDMAYLSTSSAVKVSTFTTTGSFTVPSGVTAIRAYTWGQGGFVNGWSGSSGGGGAFVCGTFNVTPGQLLQIAVNYGAGTTVGIGSNGGGLSGVFTNSISQASTIIIAAGGGGSGSGGAGGYGGILVGGDAPTGSTGGTQIAGGTSAGGGGSGSALQGGGTPGNGGGGGGGGYWGGGGGGNSGSQGAGGGGSSYLSNLFSVFAEPGTIGSVVSPTLGGFGGGKWAPFNTGTYGDTNITGAVVLVYNTLPRMANLLELRTSFTPNITAITNTNTMGINVSSVTSSITLDVGGTARSQTLSTLAFNVSSINGTVYGAFTGSTTYLSAATISVSSLKTSVLNASTAIVTWNGTVAPTSYGLGVDTLTLQTTNAGYTAGIASMAFATATASYPLARIYAVDSAASGPAVSQLVFQTVPTSATSFSSNFTYTGATTTLTIPAGVTSVNVKMWGAGGGGYAGVGGAGAFVQGSLAVTPSQVLTILVGSGGSSNATIFGGGGGPGANFASVGGGGRASVQLDFSLQPVVITITGLSGSGSSAQVTTSGSHGLSIGQPVTISGASPYNGIYVIIAVTSNTFTIPTTTTGTVTLSSPNIIAELAIAGGGGSGGYQASGIGGNATYSGAGAAGLPYGGGGGGQYNSSTPLQGGSNGGGSPSGYASPLQGSGGQNYCGEGGGGYYGGGHGGASPTTGNVYSGGGGGSSYTSLLTSVTGSNSVDGITPPATSVAGYVTGVAKGGAANGAPNAASWGGNAQIIIGTVGNSYAEAMRIGTTGNVGIGTAAPAALLDVAGTSRSQGVSTLSFNTSSINGIPFGAQALGIQTLAF